MYEISDTDSDDSGKETKSAKIKKEKKPPPVGGIPVLHAKKAKVAKVRLFILTLCFSSFTIINRNLVHSSIKKLYISVGRCLESLALILKKSS